jgi:hypothetical protein
VTTYLKMLMRWPLRSGAMPFARLVPTVVLVFGFAAAVAITVIGVLQLRVQSDERAAFRSNLLAQTLSERLSEASDAERETIIERASIRSGTEILLVEQDGTVVVDGSVSPPTAPGVV